jgi:hypothetical protein
VDGQGDLTPFHANGAPHGDYEVIVQTLIKDAGVLP